MPAKPVTAIGRLGLAALCLIGGGFSPASAKAPLPTVLLYPASPGDVPAMVDLRTRLRLDGQLEVLTYDPDSASVKRAAAETSHPEWLIGTLSDDARLALARALGVAYYAVVSPGRESDSTHIQLVETAPPALTFDWYGANRQLGARALESQAQAAHPPAVSAAGNTPAPAVVAPAPAVVAPAPAVVAPAAPAVVPIKPPVAAPPQAVAQTPEKVPLAPNNGGTGNPIPPRNLGALPSEGRDQPGTNVNGIGLGTSTPPPSTVVGAGGASSPRIASLPPAEHSLTLPTQATLTPPVKPAPSPDTIVPVKPVPTADDLAAVSSLMSKGDAAMDGEDFVGAIALYRKAINGAPLSIVPRLKLAQAYQKNGMSDKALDEAKRALEIAPNSQPLQDFLTQLDQVNGTSDGTLARFQAAIAHAPNDPAAHTGLAEALWNSGDLNGAETEYKAAKKLAPAGDHTADAHLAQLYATQARYDDCLTALQSAGKDGYALALKIVKNRADTLSSTIDTSRDAFAGGKSTREQFYDGTKKTSAQAQALADFVAKVTPPAEYKLSHLHRMLSTNLLAQEAATLVAFIESGDTKQGDSVSQLEKSAQTEMLTAQAAEEKLGLWEGAKPSP